MEISHAEWLAKRRTGIGGSDAAAVLGLSEWATPLQVYLEKRGESEGVPDTPSMLWGRLLEPVIRQRYADVTGRVVRQHKDMLRHPKHNFMIANLDGFSDCKRGLEVKTSRTSTGWGAEGTDEIPKEYLIQTQHYMEVSGLEVFDVAVLIGGSDFRIYEVPADKELQELIVEEEAEFWQLVIDGTPPEPARYSDMLLKFGGRSLNSSVEASPELIATLDVLRDAKKQNKYLEEVAESAKFEIVKALGVADTLTHQGKILATWKVTSCGTSRRFCIK